MSSRWMSGACTAIAIGSLFFSLSLYAECLACTQQARDGIANVTPFPLCCGDYPPDASSPSQCGFVKLVLPDFDGDLLPDVLESAIEDLDGDGLVDVADVSNIDPCTPDPQALACINQENVPLPIWSVGLFAVLIIGIGVRRIRRTIRLLPETWLETRRVG